VLVFGKESSIILINFLPFSHISWFFSSPFSFYSHLKGFFLSSIEDAWTRTTKEEMKKKSTWDPRQHVIGSVLVCRISTGIFIWMNVVMIQSRFWIRTRFVWRVLRWEDAQQHLYGLQIKDLVSESQSLFFDAECDQNINRKVEWEEGNSMSVLLLEIQLRSFWSLQSLKYQIQVWELLLCLSW